MIKVVAKFKEKFWDKEANAEIPMDTIYMGEALSVESQKDGMNVQQKFNGHNNGIFLKYKDMSVLQLDDATIDDFKDLDALEAACVTANATKKITFVGVNFTVGEDVEELSDPTDIDITANFKKDGKVEDKVLYLQANERYEIREVSVENAEVTVKRVEVVTPAHDGLPATSEDMVQATVHGMQGNVVMSVLVQEIKKEGEDTSSDSSGSEPKVMHSVKMTLDTSANGFVINGAEGQSSVTVEVEDGGNVTFTLTPISGYTPPPQGSFSVMPDSGAEMPDGVISSDSIVFNGIDKDYNLTVSYTPCYTVDLVIEPEAQPYVTCTSGTSMVVPEHSDAQFDLEYTAPEYPNYVYAEPDGEVIFEPAQGYVAKNNVTEDYTITIKYISKD